MKSIALIMLSFILTGCALTRDYVDIEYQPCTTPQRTVGAQNIEVSVDVNDIRAEEHVSFKINGFGMEMANIIANNDIAEVFKNAIILELQQRGFVIANEGSNLTIELSKFFNNFKPGFFKGTASSETVLNVILRKKDGTIVYSKTILGFWEETCLLATGSNASIALEKSLQQAVQNLMDDPDFISALLT